MRRHGILSIVGACTLSLIATACGEPGAPHKVSQAPAVVVPPPELAITDARDAGGAAHFYFLQPVDGRPKGQRLGPADRSLEDNLALEICLLVTDHCAQPLLARYTSTSGVGKERLQLDDDDDYYKVRWYTSRFPSVDAGQTYRLTILAAGMRLGSADVKIVKRNRDAKRVSNDDFVGLKDDEGLTIRFYIEQCGVFVLPPAGGSAMPCTSGSIIATSNQGVGVRVPAGVVAPNTSFTVLPASGPAGDASVAAGPYVFTPSALTFGQPLTLSMSVDPARVPAGVGSATLAAYELRDGSWRPAGPTILDADHNRFSFDVTHFSEYAVLAPVASVALAVPSKPLVVGATGAATAVVKDAADRVLEHRQLDWAAFPDGIVSIAGDGTITALSAGEVTITATSEGQRAAASLTVSASTAASVTIGGAVDAPLTVGLTRQLSATPLDASGAAMSGGAVAWHSSSDAIATVTATGLVTGVGPGDATITATVGPVSQSVTVHVQAVPVTSVVVTSPAVGPLDIGASRQLAAGAFNGTTPLLGRTVTWSSSNDAFVSVDPNGLVTAKAPGEATITATVDGMSGSMILVARLPVITTVSVTPPTGTMIVGGTQQFSFAAMAGSVPQSGRAVTWGSSNVAAATIDASGLATAKGAGNTTITATVDGIVGSSAVTVVLPEITTVNVAPATATLIIGQTKQLEAAAMAGTAPQTGRATTWNSSSNAVATVDGNGLVTAIAAGNATITATIGGVSGTSTITVQLPPITAVKVTPATATILVGGVQQFSAVALAGADPQSGRAVTWSSSSDAIATVDQTGLVMAKAPGNVTISAAVDGISGSGTVTVNPLVVPVTTVAISSTAIGPLDVQSTRQLTAAAFNGSTPLFGRAVTWSSSDNSVVTVDGNGLVTAVSAGAATITALVEGVPGTSALSTRGLVYGPYHLDQSLFAAPFTGALRELKPTDGMAMLQAARAAGFRLIIRPVSGSSKFQDPVTGRFRLDLWKLQVDRFRGWDFRPYIADGTIIGIYLIDEPMDPSNWTNKNACMTDGVSPTCLTDASGAIIPDPGQAVSFADIDAAAAYAKQYFPGVPMGVGSRPSELEAGAPFQNLEFGLAQYTTKKKDAAGNPLTADGFVAYEVAAAKRSRLGVQLSINVIAGNGGSPVLPTQLRSWGVMMANEPYACALTMWRWDFVNGTNGDPFNSFWSDPTNLQALRDVGAAAAKRAPVPCRPH